MERTINRKNEIYKWEEGGQLANYARVSETSSLHQEKKVGAVLPTSASTLITYQNCDNNILTQQQLSKLFAGSLQKTLKFGSAQRTHNIFKPHL